MHTIVQRWRQQARSILSNPNSKSSLREAAQRFVAQWGWQ